MSDKDNEAQESRPLHKTELTSVGAAAAIGLTAIRRLVDFGVVSIYLDKEGFVIVADPGEVGMDTLPETMAIQELVGRGYSDEQLADYLKGRDARMSRA